MGWWKISDEGGGIDMSLVGKGEIVNAVPGHDSGRELYNGDDAADIMDKAIDEIQAVYQEAWGRLPTLTELRAVFNFSTGILDESGETK